MKKDDILQFEIDDASETGINGKQVFFTKRINGKTTHNKIQDKKIENIEENKNSNDEEELFIEFKTKYPLQEEKSNKRKKTTTPNHKNKIKRKNKKRRRKSKKARLVKTFFLLILAVGAAIFTMMSPIFNIEKVEVSGNDKLSTETIISISGIRKGKNIFRTSTKEIIKKIRENSYIDKVNINRKLPGTVQINVKERQIAYQIKVIDAYVYIDYQGYILEKSSESQNVPIIEGIMTEQNTLLNGKRLDNQDIETLNLILKIMESSKKLEISELISKIRIENKELILELNSENKTVYIGNGKELTNKLTYLKAIINEEKDNKGKIFLNGELNEGFKPYFREDTNNEEQQ